MGIPREVKQIVEKQIEVMIEQTKAYLPFIKLAFPGVKDLSESCYAIIVTMGPDENMIKKYSFYLFFLSMSSNVFYYA